MAIIPIEKPGTVGILRDMPPEDAPQAAWTAGKDVRFIEDRVEKARGWGEVFSANNNGEKVLWQFPWNDGTSLWWVYATPTGIWRAKDGSREEITREDTNGNDVDYNASVDSLFSGGVFNTIPIVNNDSFQDPPQQWDSVNSRMKRLENWPTGQYCKFMQPFRNFLVAYNLEDGGTALPLTLQWSALADPGSVPASWDHTDPTILAGRTSLAQTGGSIIYAKPLLGENIIYKQDAIVNMRFSGGNFVFKFDYISETEGILAPHCATRFGESHLVVTRGDVKVNDGRRLESVIRGKNRRYLFTSMNPDYSDRTFLAHDFIRQEVWICYVSAEEDPNAVWPNIALVWNYQEDTWSLRSLPGSAYIDTGIVDTSAGSLIWNDQSEAWDDVSLEWGEQEFDPTAVSMLANQPSSGKFFSMNNTFLHDGATYKSFVQRIGAPVLDEHEQQNGELNPTRNKFIRRIYPKVDSSNPVKIRLGMQRIYGGAIDWMPTFTFDPSTDLHVDTRLNGKYLAFEISQDKASDFKFLGMGIEYETLGEAVR